MKDQIKKKKYKKKKQKKNNCTSQLALFQY